MLREDYVIRLIRQFVDVLARIAGFRKRGEYERAQVEIGRAWDELGVPRDLVLATDLATAASLFRDADQQRVAAQLLAEDAHVMQAKGDPLHAAAMRRRAIELLMHARDAQAREDDDACIVELARHIPPGALTE